MSGHSQTPIGCIVNPPWSAAEICSPEPKNPQDAVLAKQYMSNQALFKETAIYWTVKFARGKVEENPTYRERVEKLRDKGVTEDETISILSCNN
ncbi:hypothetical protein Q1695_005353 [Nippostrongylus brasiliensis]|nr:hypothetical protein Q1695_005353 [Nippostrongylus brasiliensis]